MLIQEYRTEWIEHFLSIKHEIENVLSELDIKIEHIGSTAVPGLAAKPIIDIDVIYHTDLDFEKIRSRLSKLGYFHNGNQGILHREAFKRNGITKNEVLDNLKHHLYVCPKYSEELHRHILFRNHLRKNDDARLDYQYLKHKIAKKANQHKKVYAELKEVFAKDFINSIIEQEKKDTRN